MAVLEIGVIVAVGLGSTVALDVIVAGGSGEGVGVRSVGVEV